MFVDGRAIADELLAMTKNEVSHLGHAPHLTVITAAPSFATQQYVVLKKKRAKEVGIAVNIIELPETVTTDEVAAVIDRVTIQTDGIIVQLPLPTHVDIDTVLTHIPAQLDVDGMHYVSSGRGFLPPVVGAVAEIACRHDILFAGQRVAVIGHGRLVGQPAAVWAQNQGASVSVLTEVTPEYDRLLAEADIIISGAGVAGLVTPERVQTGVICFDAGTAEVGGVAVGDIDPACESVAQLMTPVPGGIGPMTVALLLMNVVHAASARA